MSCFAAPNVQQISALSNLITTVYVVRTWETKPSNTTIQTKNFYAADDAKAVADKHNLYIQQRHAGCLNWVM